MTREEALRRLKEEPEEQCPEDIMNLFLHDLKMNRDDFDRFIDMGPRHLQFRPTNRTMRDYAKKIKRGIKMKKN